MTPTDDDTARRQDHLALLANLRTEHEDWLQSEGKELRELVLQHERLLCRKVQELREGRGWSQLELARRLGQFGFDMHQTTVAKLEAGKRPLRVAELLALSAIFGITPAALFYVPMTGESLSLEFQREELERLELVIQESQDVSMRTLQRFAETYAEYSAQRRRMVDEMLEASQAQREGWGPSSEQSDEILTSEEEEKLFQRYGIPGSEASS